MSAGYHELASVLALMSKHMMLKALRQLPSRAAELPLLEISMFFYFTSY